MEPPTDVRKKQPRKKARRSCLYCQRAHKTCGNERPCGQCVERGSPSECVDGKRKPPKYLFEPLVKRKRVRTRKTRDATTSGNKNPASGNMIITSYAHPLPPGGRHNSHTGNAPTPRRDPFEDIFDQTIDQNCFFAASLGSDFEEQTLTDTLGEEGPDPFCRGEHWRRSEELSSSPDSSEVGISDQFLEDAPGFQSSGCQIPPNQRIYYGFAIGSGWSGTFFPDG